MKLSPGNTKIILKIKKNKKEHRLFNEKLTNYFQPNLSISFNTPNKLITFKKDTIIDKESDTKTDTEPEEDTDIDFDNDNDNDTNTDNGSETEIETDN